MNKKMRVWWIPQLGCKTAFYIPVSSVEEAKKVMDILAYYDCFQYNNECKADYANAGGLEIWNEDSNDWVDWYYNSEYDFDNDVDSYCEEKSENYDELVQFSKTLAEQVHFD